MDKISFEIISTVLMVPFKELSSLVQLPVRSDVSVRRYSIPGTDHF